MIWSGGGGAAGKRHKRVSPVQFMLTPTRVHYIATESLMLIASQQDNEMEFAFSRIKRQLWNIAQKNKHVNGDTSEWGYNLRGKGLHSQQPRLY